MRIAVEATVPTRRAPRDWANTEVKPTSGQEFPPLSDRQASDTSHTPFRIPKPSGFLPPVIL